MPPSLSQPIPCLGWNRLWPLLRGEKEEGNDGMFQGRVSAVTWQTNCSKVSHEASPAPPPPSLPAPSSLFAAPGGCQLQGLAPSTSLLHLRSPGQGHILTLPMRSSSYYQDCLDITKHPKEQQTPQLKLEEQHPAQPSEEASLFLFKNTVSSLH